MTVDSIPNEPDNAFIEFLNRAIIDEGVEKAKPHLQEEIEEALTHIKRELTDLLPQRARGVVADIIGLDDDEMQSRGMGEEGSTDRGIFSDFSKEKLMAKIEKRKDDVFRPIRERIQEILERVAEAVQHTVHSATQYTANEASDVMARSVKEALRQWDEGFRDDPLEEGPRDRSINPDLANEGSHTFMGYAPGGGDAPMPPAGVYPGMDLSRGERPSDVPDNIFEALSTRLLGSRTVQKIQDLAERTDAIRWISLHVERIIQRTLQLVHPLMSKYIAQETSGVSTAIVGSFRGHIERVMEEGSTSSKKHWWDGIIDKIQEMDAKGKFEELEARFARHVQDIVGWVLRKLQDVVMWLTERKLRIELDKLPGVRVIEPVV
ncbi:hypothetical protein BJ684DRAFT_20450 [Piptocephalis cylindrospora]|uniref:Uncharacterized protein n=1 Tax=Piptocephalis cylindrospora TaxID=1907219 RepID=A0A4P9Y2H5_9FUNG|nr:hypothetical protein BJ684DRAFT_20450 [Piptocephalis cylindrospora]|eukprot:RKP13037.1 hypothetical protein BJ684DRAFT_20450 [Piptocephalis cylindrospora]